MGEPSLPANHLIPSLHQTNLVSLIHRKFPGAVIQEVEGTFYLLSIHGVGATEREVMENALTEYNNMTNDGRSLPQILNDVENDLHGRPGMSRQRHDDLIELLGTAEQALNGGILTETVPWIMVAGYNRRIEDLRRRIDTRLNMVALDMQEREKARQRAGTKFPRHTEINDGLTDYQRMQATAQR
jgi:hypothetical protein